MPKLVCGYTLVEMTIYVSVLLVITFVVVNTTLSFTKSYRELKTSRLVEHSALDAMERMTRDIRGADSVDVANSTLGTSPGVLTIVSTVNSLSTTTKFYVQNNILTMDVNGVYFGPLSLSDASVTNLTFRRYDSGISESVRIDLTVEASLGPVTKLKTYHSTIILKGV